MTNCSNPPCPLYADLDTDERQRMIVRTFFKEALASFIRAGLGPSDKLGRLVTRQLAWLCTFSAGVILGLPAPSLQFSDYTGFFIYLNTLVRNDDGADLQRVWTELTTLVIALEATIGMEGVFILTAPESPRGAVRQTKALGVVSHRFHFLLRLFDSTKGFPGEGPPRPEHAFLA
jgi:hypothetical protein